MFFLPYLSRLLTRAIGLSLHENAEQISTKFAGGNHYHQRIK